MNLQPLVTIITVCYHSEKYLRDAIESVINQTYKNIEYIIIDGNSKDKTLDIIKEYEPKFEGRMRYISEPDNGIYNAMNKGIKMSKGDIIGIINSDDWYETNAIELIVNKYIKSIENNKYIIFFGNMNKCNDEKKIMYISKKNKKYLNENIDKRMTIPHPTVFVTRDVYFDKGMYDEKLKICADYKLILNNYHRGSKFIYINKTISNMRGSGMSDRASTFLMMIKERFFIRAKYIKLNKNILYFIKEITIELFKKNVKSLLYKMNKSKLVDLYYKKRKL